MLAQFNRKLLILTEFRSRFKTFEYGNEISCSTYLKTNLFYDLRTNNASFTGFTDIFYSDFRSEEVDGSKYWRDDYLFSRRYLMFQDITTESFPGYTIAPIKVDVMFQIVTINERK